MIINSDIALDFDCGNQRAITYFLEPLLILSLFGKYTLDIHLQGITNDEIDISIDNFIYTTIPLIKLFECESYCKVIKRGFKPIG